MEQMVKLRRGRTRCIKLGRNGCNERESLEFNAEGKICSPNATVFANWCGCVVRKRTNVPLQCKDWKDIPKEPVDYEAKLLDVISVGKIQHLSIRCEYFSCVYFKRFASSF
jgi:hypothetical protein